jgi:hypothetical protein
MNTSTRSHFYVFTVEEFDAPTPEDLGRKGKSWTKVGVAFPHKEGTGYNIQLRSVPLDGKLVVLPANGVEDAGCSESSRNVPQSIQGARMARRLAVHLAPGTLRRQEFCMY